MYLAIRRKPPAITMLLLSFLLVFGTIFSSPQAFAEADGSAAPAAENTGPTNLKIVEGTLTHNSVDIQWDFRENKDDNNIQIWNADTGGYVVWGNYWTRKVANLAPETTYRIYITWNEDTDKKYKSNTLEFTTLPDTSEYKEAPLTAPSYLTVTGVTYDSVTLGWGASPKAAAYDFYVNGAWIQGIWDPSVTSVTYKPAGGIAPGTKLSFLVAAQIDPSNFSPKSNKLDFVWGNLTAPKDLQVVSTTTSSVALGWASVAGATYYDIYQDGQLIGVSHDNRYTITGLQEGKAVQYHVVAKNDLWQSPESNSISATPGANYNHVSYYISWAGSESARNFQPDDIDVTQLTHINYAFSDLCWKKNSSAGRNCTNPSIQLQKDYVYDGEIIIGDPEVDFKYMKELNDLKAINPDLKILSSVGGWSWSVNFSNMAADEISRRTFANSIVKFLRAYQLDGIDIDWEYPVEGGDEKNSRRPEDKINFTLMAKTVREALDAAGMEDGKYYLQTIAAAQGDNYISNADMAVSSAYLDFINIMTYDYSGDWATLAHHNSPMYYDAKHPLSGAKRNNVQGSVSSFIKNGVPNHKVVLGVPFYGKGWDGCPEPGEYQTCLTQESSEGSYETGVFDIYDLEDNYINKNGYVRYWNEASKNPYLYNKEIGRFITYNDENTMLYTASIVKSLDIAGVMSWDITSDRNKSLTTPLVSQLPHNGTVSSTIAAPDNVKAESFAHNSAKISWDAVPGATAYEVYVDGKYVSTVADTTYLVESLIANTKYNVHLLSIVKEDDKLQDVSATSKSVEVTTRLQPPYNGTSGSNVPAPTPTPTVEGQLAASVTKDGEKLIVQVNSVDAIKTIKAATAPDFRIVLTENGNPIELTIPKDVVAAATAKGDNATITIVTPNGEITIPVQAINVENDIKVTIQAPAKSAQDAMTKWLAANGFKSVINPLQVNIEQVKADKSVQAISISGKNAITFSYKLADKAINTANVTGAVYAAEVQSVRSVPTLFQKNADGSVTAQFKSSNGQIHAVIAGSFSFSDANTAWAKQDIALAASKLIALGKSGNVFGANDKITRAEFTSMIIRALGIIPDTTTSGFKDVSAQSKYAADIAAAKKAGIIQGKTEALFNPDGAITRQDIAVIFANALQYAGLKNTAKLSQLAAFKDQSDISAYAKSSLAWMIEQKMIQGVSATKLDPKSNATKAQATVIVMRMLRALNLTN